MATETVAGPYGETRVASAAAGTALTTTAAFIALPLESKHLWVYGRNFSTAVVARWGTNPWLTILKTGDNNASIPDDHSDVAQDADTATSVPLAMAITGTGFLWVGSHLQIRGVDIDMDGSNVNDTASILTVRYWDGGALADISDTDTTISSGKSLAQDGTVSWTVPSGWEASTLKEMGVDPRGIPPAYRDNKLFWTRWEWSAATDAGTAADHMLAMNRSTAYAGWSSALGLEEKISHGKIGGIGCIEAITDAGTANLMVNVASGNGSKFR
jgi:hypothetical protein